MKVKTGAVDKNIYVEKRSGALRFVVQVSPLPKVSATFDLTEYDSALIWAQRKRVELLEQKKGKGTPAGETNSIPQPVAVSFEPVVKAPVRQSPASVAIKEIIASYRDKELHKLASAASARSRLQKLDEWFGRYQVCELTREELEAWLAKRKAGKLGMGRARIPPAPKQDASLLTKHQRARQKKTGKPIPKLQYSQVSSQTIRHELVLLRRAVTVYFQDWGVDVVAWVAAHPLMRIDLPAPAAARKVRIDDAQFSALREHLASPMQIAFVLVAIATTLRRAEVCSLRWEDVNFEKSEVLLRAPGHRDRTKTHERHAPLLPVVADVLRSLGPKKEGRIFQITPSGITQAMRRAADRANLREIRLHDTRREGISRLVELFNASLQTVIAFSGHTSEDALQKHYINPHASKVAQRLSAHPAAAKLLPAI